MAGENLTRPTPRPSTEAELAVSKILTALLQAGELRAHNIVLETILGPQGSIEWAREVLRRTGRELPPAGSPN